MYSKYSEVNWFLFGVMTGLMNLVKNGIALGLKKTIGKILQPINYYTRFPEYSFFAKSIGKFVDTVQSDQPLKVLDIGSPKLFGLYLAYYYTFYVQLTDISSVNIDEYVTLWNAIQSTAKGKTTFVQQDGRMQPYPDESFDIIYSMSVLEHIDGNEPEIKFIAETLRLLRPGGLLILSVPFGDKYVEQTMTGFSYVAQGIDQQENYFFQRIYDQSTLQTRLLNPLLSQVNKVNAWTVFRKQGMLTQWYHTVMPRLGENINGLFGFLNPIFSYWINQHKKEIYTEFYTSYGQNHSHHDVYGDVILVCQKP